KILDVDLVYETLVGPICAINKLGIEGEAGTGKTMIGILQAQYFLELNKKVLFLSSNPILNLLIQQKLGGEATVNTYTGLAKDFQVNFLTPPKSFKGTKDQWEQKEAPKTLMENIPKHKKAFYDVIICDEAQDVQPAWWEPILLLLQDKKKQGRLYLFFDRSQGIFGSGSKDKKFVPQDTLPVPPNYFPLVNNYRTTNEISLLAAQFRSKTHSFGGHFGRSGYIPELITYRDKADFLLKLESITKLLIKEEELLPNDITLLSAREPEMDPSVINAVKDVGGVPFHRLIYKKNKKWKQTKTPSNAIGVSTITSFKGLETKIGILINLSEYNLPLHHPIMASLIYVAITRAKHMLYIFIKEGDDKHKAFEKTISKIDPGGSLVLTKEDSDSDFIGTVVYFNPKRMGILSVVDPNFSKRKVIFFPDDIERLGLQPHEVVNGMKIRFRPNVEGTMIVATQLEVVESKL
ncbi:DUF2075 domain-containing protein, partial [Bacteriovoracaceae bacterium]|nr:DUF2075 domain-containing protein [Bacteriovoracaceae bacterium]